MKKYTITSMSKIFSLSPFTDVVVYRIKAVVDIPGRAEAGELGGWIEKEENDALNKRNSTWLCSLSKVKDSILMWSHYCHNHEGVCIGLDLDKVMESVPPMFDVMYIKPLVLDIYIE